jgi:hypothetical protein
MSCHCYVPEFLNHCILGCIVGFKWCWTYYWFCHMKAESQAMKQTACCKIHARKFFVFFITSDILFP